jgi:hypothetical protein
MLAGMETGNDPETHRLTLLLCVTTTCCTHVILFSPCRYGVVTQNITLIQLFQTWWRDSTAPLVTFSNGDFRRSQGSYSTTKDVAQGRIYIYISFELRLSALGSTPRALVLQYLGSLTILMSVTTNTRNSPIRYVELIQLASDRERLRSYRPTPPAAKLGPKMSYITRITGNGHQTNHRRQAARTADCTGFPGVTIIISVQGKKKLFPTAARAALLILECPDWLREDVREGKKNCANCV